MRRKRVCWGAGVAIGLGTAGGLLIAGICIGYLSSLNPTFGRVPAAARYILRELGLMLLMASIGLNAGAGILDGLASIGPAIILCAVAVAVVPVVAGYAFGRLVLKLNPALLLGALTGAMTSTPALSIVTDAAKSSVPNRNGRCRRTIHRRDASEWNRGRGTAPTGW